MFNRVSAIVLFVQDFPACLTFYRDTLGLPVAQLEAKFVAFKMQDQDFALQELGQSAEMVGVDVSAFEPLSGKLVRSILCADVDDVDAIYATLSAKGVPFTRPPLAQPWGYRVAYFNDPEGNLWELRQSV